MVLVGKAGRGEHKETLAPSTATRSDWRPNSNSATKTTGKTKGRDKGGRTRRVISDDCLDFRDSILLAFISMIIL
jgi:hypothetical protein